MPQAAIADEDIDLISDIEEGTDNANPGEVKELNKPENDDVRSLLENALKEDQNGRLRGPDGKFAAATPAAEPAAAGDGTQNTGTPPEGTDTGAALVQTAFKLAPEYDALLSTLPEANRAAAREALVARETAIAQYVQGLAGQVSGYGGIEQHLAPRRQAWAVQGVTPEAAVGQLFALSDFATSDPQGFLTWFAGNNGIDLSQLGEDIIPLSPELEAFNKRLGGIETALTGLTNGHNQNAHGQLMQAIDTFAATAGTDGQPKYPHFNAVMNDMVSLVPAIRQQNPHLNSVQLLETAYERAVYANPTTRQQVIDAQAAKVISDRVAAARKARDASQSLPAGAGGGSAPLVVPEGKNDTVRDALMSAIAQHSQ